MKKKRKVKTTARSHRPSADYLEHISGIQPITPTANAAYFKIGTQIDRVGSGGAPDGQTIVIEVRNQRTGDPADGAYLIFGRTPTNPEGNPMPPAFDPTFKMLYIFYRLDQLEPIRSMLAGMGSRRGVYVYYGEFGPTKWAEVHSVIYP